MGSNSGVFSDTAGNGVENKEQLEERARSVLKVEGDEINCLILDGVEFLEDPKAFVQLLLRIENGASFLNSFHASYAASPSEQWRNFVSRLSK